MEIDPTCTPGIKFWFVYVWDWFKHRHSVWFYPYILCSCAAICLCVAFADFTIQNHPQHIMGGVSNLSAVALAAQLSATAGTNFSGGLQGYHGAVVSGNTPPTGKTNKLSFL